MLDDSVLVDILKEYRFDVVFLRLDDFASSEYGFLNGDLKDILDFADSGLQLLAAGELQGIVVERYANFLGQHIDSIRRSAGRIKHHGIKHVGIVLSAVSVLGRDACRELAQSTVSAFFRDIKIVDGAWGMEVEQFLVSDTGFDMPQEAADSDAIAIRAWIGSAKKNVIGTSNNGSYDVMQVAGGNFVMVPLLRDVVRILDLQYSQGLVFLDQIRSSIRGGDSLQLREHIKSAITEEFCSEAHDIQAVCSDSYEAEIVSCICRDIKLVDRYNDSGFEVEDRISSVKVSFAVRANIDVEIHLSFSKWDGVDKEYFGIGGKTILEDIEREFDVAIDIDGTVFDLLTVDDIANIFISGGRGEIDLGEIDAFIYEDDDCFEGP